MKTSDPRHLLWAFLIGFATAVPVILGIQGCADREPVKPVVVVPDIPVAVEGVRVLMLYDKEGNQDGHYDAMFAGDVEAALNAKCGKDGWRRWDDKQHIAGESDEWKAIYAAAMAKWPDTNKPALFVVRKQTVTYAPMPDEVSAALVQINSLTGE